MKYSPIVFVCGLLFFLLIGVSACKKDPVETDPCAQSICLNGSECESGQCQCPEGFSGADCGTRVTPESLVVTSLQISDFPLTDLEQQPWDITGGPDLQAVLYCEDRLLEVLQYRHLDAKPGEANFMELPQPLVLEHPQAVHTLFIYDSDGHGQQQLMGTVVFTPYSPPTGFPELLVLDQEGPFLLELGLNYVF